MDERQLLDDLKQRYAYDAWRDRNTLDENLFVWGFFLSGNECPGWQPHRIRRIEATTPAALEAARDSGLAARESPVAFQSLWKRPEGGTEALLNVNIFECASRTAAHEFLVRLLGEFQSPLIARLEQIPVGDVAFGGPGDAVLLFARANLVHLIQNAGRDLLPVTGVAGQFDRELTSKPETVEGQIVPALERMRAVSMEAQVDTGVRLELEAPDAAERPLMYKFFSRSGEVLRQRESLIYQSASAGQQEIDVYATTGNGDGARQTLRLSVE